MSLPLLLLFGCESSSIVPGTTVTCWLEHDGLVRYYLLRVPAEHPGRTVPVVVALHGLGSEPESIEGMSGLSELADKEGFMAIYPAGIEITQTPDCPKGQPTTLRGWNAGGCCAGPAEDDIDDVGFILRVLEEVDKKVAIDFHRVYAVGMSNGGFMASRLACDVPEIFAAVASVEGGLSTPCDPDVPVSILYVHGTEDPAVPYDGKPNVAVRILQECGILPEFEPIEDTVATWVRQQGCEEEPVREQTVGSVLIRTWTSCDDDVCVELCTVTGGGHTWPGSQDRWSYPEATGPCVDFDASAYIWQFFNKFQR
jgi:polyhydroxybutyrate depolymerase